MKKNYVAPDMRIKGFCRIHLATNSDLVRNSVANAGYTSINMTTVKTQDIEWKNAQ